MATRESYWYSIISYIPSSIRYERINVGTILGNKSNTKLLFEIIPATSKKIKNFIWSDIELKEYAVASELLKSLINSNYIAPSLLSTPINNSMDWSKWLNAEIPSGIVFSNVHFARTEDPKFIFEHLLEEYVDKQFFKANSDDGIVTVKENVKEYFKRKKLLDYKLKSRVTINPSKKIPLAIKMDYMYFNRQDKKVGLVQIPSIEDINTWYERTYTFLSKTDSDNFRLNIILDENDYNDNSQLVQPFMNEFDKSQNVSKLLIPQNNNEPLNNLTEDIEKSSNVEEWKVSDFLKYIA